MFEEAYSSAFKKGYLYKSIEVRDEKYKKFLKQYPKPKEQIVEEEGWKIFETRKTKRNDFTKWRA